MKCIGILGGMSAESSMEYERIMNAAVREQLGGSHSADLIVRSYDFAKIEVLQEEGGWDLLAQRLGADAVALEAAGAELMVIATNTMHNVAPQVEAAISIPLIHIADATAEAVKAVGLSRVALLGTRYTMEMTFYSDRMQAHGIDVLVPDEPDRTTVHDIIYDELVRGVVSPDSKAEFLRIIDALVASGAQGVIAGCTEIELLIAPEDVSVPMFCTARIHALAAIEAALEE
jgi:aspartate racemase